MIYKVHICSMSHMINWRETDGSIGYTSPTYYIDKIKLLGRVLNQTNTEDDNVYFTSNNTSANIEQFWNKISIIRTHDYLYIGTDIIYRHSPNASIFYVDEEIYFYAAMTPEQFLHFKLKYVGTNLTYNIIN